jgi:hypothetical protein
MRSLVLFSVATLAVSVAFTAASCGGETTTSTATGSTTSASSSGSGGSSGSSGSSGTTGTTGGGDGRLLDKDCDPLVPSHCGFPFPSNVYLEDDGTTKTGKHVVFRKFTLPPVAGVGHLDPATWLDSDGFSPGQAPMTDLPGATVTGLPTQDTIEASLSKDSPTILLDTSTGELVPHFAELDVSSATGDGDHAFMIRPVVRLKDATRYIVAVRHVVDKNSAPLAPSPVFQALRDGGPSDEASVESRRALYADIFAQLEKVGVKKADLQIAWDYSTASRENNTAAMVAMRDAALAKVGTEGPKYTILSVDENPNPMIRRRLHVMMTVPLYLDKPGPGGKLVLGPDGLPKQNGEASYEVLVHIPNSLVTNGTTGAPLQNGHGLLGDKTEGQDGFLATMANKHGYVAFAVDFIGMAEEDLQTVTDAITGDIGSFRQCVDRQHQGMLNSLLAMRMMRGAFAKDPQVTFNGKSVIDTSTGFYRGDSQGGIFGTSYMALSTDVTRGLLGEPGMSYNLLLNRSKDFDPFFGALQLVYANGRDIQLGLAVVQMVWDRMEPTGYAPYINENMLPNTPKHEILIHAAIGDQQVTPLGAHILARTVHAKNLKPTNRTIFGIPDADGPITGSTIVEFNFGLLEVPKTNTPPTGALYPDSDDPHDKVRKLDVAFDQSNAFFRTGIVTPTCVGPCDPQ